MHPKSNYQFQPTNEESEATQETAQQDTKTTKPKKVVEKAKVEPKPETKKAKKDE